MSAMFLRRPILYDSPQRETRHQSTKGQAGGSFLHRRSHQKVGQFSAGVNTCAPPV